jgi:hypothetical protein
MAIRYLSSSSSIKARNVSHIIITSYDTLNADPVIGNAPRFAAGTPPSFCDPGGGRAAAAVAPDFVRFPFPAAAQRRHIKAVDMRFYCPRRIAVRYAIVCAIRKRYYPIAAFPAYEFHGRFLLSLEHAPPPELLTQSAPITPPIFTPQRGEVLTPFG